MVMWSRSSHCSSAAPLSRPCPPQPVNSDFSVSSSLLCVTFAALSPSGLSPWSSWPKPRPWTTVTKMLSDRLGWEQDFFWHVTLWLLSHLYSVSPSLIRFSWATLIIILFGETPGLWKTFQIGSGSTICSGTYSPSPFLPVFSFLYFRNWWASGLYVSLAIGGELVRLSGLEITGQMPTWKQVTCERYHVPDGSCLL